MIVPINTKTLFSSSFASTTIVLCEYLSYNDDVRSQTVSYVLMLLFRPMMTTMIHMLLFRPMMTTMIHMVMVDYPQIHRSSITSMQGQIQLSICDMTSISVYHDDAEEEV